MNQRGISKRHLLKCGLVSALTTSIRATAIGVPASFLMQGKVSAQSSTAKIVILGLSAEGESINVSGPLSFDTDKGYEITHALGQGLDTPAEVLIGAQRHQVAQAWKDHLPQGFFDQLCYFMHRTGTDAHNKWLNYLKMWGAITRADGRGEEEYPSALAQELADLLGTPLKSMFVLDRADGVSENGIPLNHYSPQALKSLLAPSSSQIDFDTFDRLHSHTIDQMHRSLKLNGTKEQKRYLDQVALSRIQAKDIGNALGELIEGVTGDAYDDQLRVALAMAKLRLAPVISVGLDWGRDNHTDTNLELEAAASITSLKSLSGFWGALQTNGLDEQVLFATMNIFGRTPMLGDRTGRDHYGDMTAGMIVGSTIKAGVVGSVKADAQGKPLAQGINSQTGASANPDIAEQNTLQAFGKTLMAAAGIPEERIDQRISAGKIVSAALR